MVTASAITQSTIQAKPNKEGNKAGKKNYKHAVKFCEMVKIVSVAESV